MLVTAVGAYQKCFSIQLFIDGLFISHSLVSEILSQTADFVSSYIRDNKGLEFEGKMLGISV